MASVLFPNAPVGGGGDAYGNGGGAGGADGFYQSSFVANGGYNAGGAPGAAPYNGSANAPNPAEAQYYMPTPQDGGENFDNEPPLLEELGINIPAVLKKAKVVANPFSKIDSAFADEADMTGPVALFLILGVALLVFQRKDQFGFIYGQATVGCIAVYIMFNLMSLRGIDMYRSTSILGYSLMPIVMLSFFYPLRNFRWFVAFSGTACILWSTTTATKIFVAVLNMHDQFWLVFYPLALLYTSFAFITVF